MTAASDAAEATRGSAIRLGAEVAARLLSLATTFLLAVGLGVEGFGTYATLFGVALIVAQLGDLGLQQVAAPALVSGALSLRDLVSARLRLAALLAAVAMALGVAARALPAQLAWAASLPVFVVYAGLATAAEFIGVCLRARRRPMHEAAVLVLLKGAPLAAVALALEAGGGVERVARALALSPLAAAGVGAVFLWRAQGGTPARARRSFRDALRMSLPLAANAVLALASLRIETVALMLLRGPAESGAFAAALKIVEWLLGAAAAVNAGALPSLAREATRLATGVRARTTGTVALLALPASIGLAVVAPGLPRWLGPGYEAAVAPLRILAIALGVMFLNAVRMHALVAAGRGDVLPRLTAVRVSIAVLGALSLVPRLGATGGALGLLVAEAALLLLAGRACETARFEVPVARPVALAAGLSLPMALAVLAAGRGPLASAALGAGVYAATIAVAYRAGFLALDRT